LGCWLGSTCSRSSSARLGSFWLLFGLLGLRFASPRPVTVRRSTTRRLPANELAIRFAVCLSLPVGTVPVSSMVSAVTLMTTPDRFCFWNSVSIWLRSVAPSVVVVCVPMVLVVPVPDVVVPADGVVVPVVDVVVPVDGVVV